MLELRSHALRLLVRPEIGGAVAQLDWLAGPQPVPLFRPWDGDSDDPTSGSETADTAVEMHPSGTAKA